MVIHYLQNTEPPILPVLQDPGPDLKRPIYGINGWNVWFNDDLTTISMKPNPSTLTQLLKGFFIYYGTFDFDFYVVTIRKYGHISRCQKSWNHCMMAIEGKFIIEQSYSIYSQP